MNYRDRTCIAGIVALSMLVFGFYFAGSSNAMQGNFLTTRMIVERGQFEITDFRERTGDVSIYQDRLYSNKPPGLSILAAAPYWIIYHIDRALDLDPAGFWREYTNARIITFLTCGLSGSALGAMMFIALRRRGTTQALAAGMSLAFIFGSIVFPYTGMLFNHLMVTALFFGAWLLLRLSPCKGWQVLLASLSLGWAVLSEYMIAVPVLAMMVFDTVENRDIRRAVMLCIGPALGVAGLMFYQHAIFGNAFAASYVYEQWDVEPGSAYTGRFSWPNPMVVYWITFHRLRGLYYCCPVFAVGFLALAKRKNWSIGREDGFAWFVIGWFVLFEMTYKYWTGGNGIGPRFCLPAMPFLFLMTKRGFENFPIIAWILATMSVLIMLIVTTVEPHYVANVSGPPTPWDPVGAMTAYFLLGRISRTRRMTNWAVDLGYYHSWGVLPVLIVIALGFAACWKLRDRPSPPLLPAR